MTMDVFILYRTDEHFTCSNQVVLGVFSGKDKAADAASMDAALALLFEWHEDCQEFESNLQKYDKALVKDTGYRIEKVEMDELN